MLDNKLKELMENEVVILEKHYNKLFKKLDKMTDDESEKYSLLDEQLYITGDVLDNFKDILDYYNDIEGI